MGAAIQAGSSIYGEIESKKAGNQVLKSIQDDREANRKWYETEMGQDYLQRADAQNILRKQRELLDEQMRKSRAINVVAGGTDESLALQQKAANQTLGETMANMAAQSESHDEAVENQYKATEASLNQQERAYYQNQSQQIAQAAGQVGKAVSGLMGGTGKAASGTMPTITPDVDTVADEALAEATANENAAFEEIKKSNN